MKIPLRWPLVFRVCALGLALVASGCASGGPAPASAGSEGGGVIHVAAAASLEPVFSDLAAEFEREHPEYSVAAPTFDGSALLATQIMAGAPVDVFLSADQRTMRQVEDGGLLDAPPLPFATNALVIAVAPGNPLGIQSLGDLVEPDEVGVLPIVVMCAAEVPCGSSAQMLLDRDRVVLRAASEEQNVTAVLRKVAAGHADAGLVYRTDVRSAGDAADGVPITRADEAATEYQVGVLGSARDARAARAFANFLLTNSAQALLRDHGFGAA